MSQAKLPGTDRAVVLIHGIEPNMRWRAFCLDIVGIMLELGVETAVLLGALLADAPHSRPVPVTAASSDTGLTNRLQLEPARYEGPTGVGGGGTGSRGEERGGRGGGGGG